MTSPRATTAREALEIARASGLLTPRRILSFLGYYAIGVLRATSGATAMLLLVDLVIGRAGRPDATFATRAASRLVVALGYTPSTPALGVVLIGTLLVGVASTFAHFWLEGFLEADFRRRIQEGGFTALVQGSWELLREMRVGERVGAITEESTNVARYYMALLRGGYNLIALLIFVAIVLSISALVSVVVAVVGLPVLLVIKHLFTLQARLTERIVAERQGFYAQVTERLHAMFQIKVEGNEAHHVASGLRNQEEMTAIEVDWWRLRAAINALNVFLPAVVVGGLYGWSYVAGTPVQTLLQLLAGIGVVGTQALSQANQLTANLGNLTAYAGSVRPVRQLYAIRPEIARARVPERVVGVELHDVAYRYTEGARVHPLSLTVGVGRPLLLMGPSGSGKTTLANVIAGLYRPTQGHVAYVGESGRIHDGGETRPRVGYVPQDIQLFQGSVRENLVGGMDAVDDDTLRQALTSAGADAFVARMGGLDAMIVEAGRSLSGGERRRLGIARVLAGRPDVLILDEVTVGLDEQRKAELLATIRELADRLVVIAITHDTDMADATRFNVVRLSE